MKDSDWAKVEGEERYQIRYLEERASCYVSMQGRRSSNRARGVITPVASPKCDGVPSFVGRGKGAEI